MEVTPKPGGEEPSLRAEEILAALDDDQREVALATRGPVCVIAGAGTGKTRAITTASPMPQRSEQWIPAKF